MRNIFKSLTIKRLYFNVSLVCHSWRSSSWDVLFWKDEETFELTSLCEIIRPFRFGSIPITNRRKILLKSLLKPCLLYHLSQRCVKTIIFAPCFYFSTIELVYLGTRYVIWTSSLFRLFLFTIIIVIITISFWEPI